MNRTLHIFDFDDTLVKSDTLVRISHYDGAISELTSSEFAGYTALDGDSYDFSEFETYPQNGMPISSMFKALRDSLNMLGSNNVVILTARSNDVPVYDFLVDHGIDRSIEVVTVGSSDPTRKGEYVYDRVLNDGYDDIKVYEDNIKNINAIKNVLSDLDVNFSYVHVLEEDEEYNDTLIRNIVRGIIMEKKY
tara:strand:- start:4292 stop:4867 length:576 start_codon:yes stop_codon:yes gene_type:complete